jgi:hypothetical protein
MGLAAYAGTEGSSVNLLGFTMQPHFISLSPSACRSLDEFTYERARPKDSGGLDTIAVGLSTLAHESQHVRHPAQGEAMVECYGLQSISRVAALLGGRARYGETVARADWRDLYADMPSDYQTSACRSGGPLDLHPADPTWP